MIPTCSQDVHREVSTNGTDVTDLGGGVGPLNQSEASLVSGTLTGPVVMLCLLLGKLCW